MLKVKAKPQMAMTCLSQQFLGTVAALDIHKCIVGIAHVTLTKSTQSQLHKCAVVQNL